MSEPVYDQSDADLYWLMKVYWLMKDFREMRARAEQAERLLEQVVLTYGPWHDEDCPMDDTCECSAKPLHDAINDALRQSFSPSRAHKEPHG